LFRIKKAQELLKTGEYSVLDVAEAVNIPDVCYFSKLFKKLTGASPLNYKSNN
jgi:YesN/AraC family two-component response regulator